MKPIALSLSKFDQESINEDSVYATSSIIAVSDGAGGGGLYAEKWSAYLLENIPKQPITSFEDLDCWIESIWEPFYNDCEAIAKKSGGLFLDKFYDEGSFATLAVAWKVSNDVVKWMSYGDSVVFHYNMRTGILEHSFTSLSDFNNSPYLINCKDPLNVKGFRTGVFNITDDSYLFCTSDALAFYILLIYELSQCSIYHYDLEKLELLNGKNAQHLKCAMLQKEGFKTSIKKLLNCRTEINLERHIRKLLKLGLISVDDYSIAIIH